MANNTYTSLVNIDDATTFDSTHWLTEARGLSLRLLDAEEDLDTSEKDAREILEKVMDKRLEQIAEQGKAAKEAVLRRIEFEKKVSSWNYTPDWYADKYLEDNAEITMSHYNYMKHIYRETQANFKQWITETTPLLAAEIYEQRFERLLAVEKAECDHEYEESNPQEVLGRFNNLHWEGCRKAGKERVAYIKHYRQYFSAEKATNMLNHTKELYSNRQLCKREYLECCMLLSKQLGYMGQYRTFKEEIKALDSKPQREEFKALPFEPSSYSMDMESGLDIKRQALEMASMHLSIAEALSMLIDGE